MNTRIWKRKGLVRQHGVTLLEVVIVMVMLGILAAIAIPNYSEYVRRSHRATAQEYLMSLASRQAQFYLDRRAFTATVADLRVSAPAEVANRYTVAIEVVAGPPAGFTITASPTGTQTGDRCGDLTIDSTGARRAIVGGADVAGCW